MIGFVDAILEMYPDMDQNWLNCILATYHSKLSLPVRNSLKIKEKISQLSTKISSNQDWYPKRTGSDTEFYNFVLDELVSRYSLLIPRFPDAALFFLREAIFQAPFNHCKFQI